MAAWLKPHLWGDNFRKSQASCKYYAEGHGARYFIIERRARDGAVCMWYKPDASHATIYPTKKQDGEPVVQNLTLPDGTVLTRYVTCPEGIEIFNSLEGPEGEPSVAPFPKATKQMILKRQAMEKEKKGKRKSHPQGIGGGGSGMGGSKTYGEGRSGDDSSDDEAPVFAESAGADGGDDSSDDGEEGQADAGEPLAGGSEEEQADAGEPLAGEKEADPADPVSLRLNTKHVMEAVRKIAKLHPSSFQLGAAASIELWEKWCDSQPRFAREVQMGAWTWPAEHTVRDNLPLSAVELSQTYTESIAYVNAVGGTVFDVQQAQQADMEVAREQVRQLTEADVLMVIAPSLPAEDAPASAKDDRMWNAPLWMCKVAQSDPEGGSSEPNVNIYWCACGPTESGLRMAGKW